MSDDIKSVVKAIESLAKRIDAIEQRIGGGESGKQRTVWELTKIMECREKEAQEYKNTHSSEVAFGTQWDIPEFQTEYAQMRREIRELNHQIASFNK